MKQTKLLTKLKYCPDCGNTMDIDSRKDDGSKYEMTCRRCLKYWDFIRHDMLDSDIRELASE